MGPETTAGDPNQNRAGRQSLRGWGVLVTFLPSVFTSVAVVAALRFTPEPGASLQVGHVVALSALLVGGAIQFWAVRRLLNQVHALSLIGQTLTCWSHGEPDAEALRITQNDLPATQSWNRLVTQMAETLHEQKAQHVNDAIAAATSQSSGQQATLDALPHGVLVIDAERNLTSANGAACRMLMRSRERLLGAPADKLTNDPALLELLDKTLRTSDSRGGHVEITLNPGEEQQAIVRATVRPLGRGQQNTQRSAVIFLEDVTQQRTADQSRNLFVAQATHELRTPLTNIGLYLERAIDLDDHETADRAECLNVINSEVIRLGRVVEEVLSVSEIEAGSHKLHRDDVRLQELLDRIQDEYQAQAAKKTIELEFDLPPKMPVVQGDRDKIGLALHNLVSNAIKYTPAGGNVKVAVNENRSDLEITVTDSGIGISEEDLAKVFEKFYRADDQRLRDITGSGLGLSLAREVIRLHGGDITAESVFNQGSTFTMRLPINAAVPATD